MNRDFTWASYRAILKSFQGLGYQVRSYEDADPAAKHLILRHDLDMSLQAAEPIAEIEHELGLRAHYFVLIRTEMYNPFSVAARAALDRIRQNGHEIGLHLDASLYENDTAMLEAAAAWECRALEDATGAPVRFISFHRPAESLLGYDGRLAGRRHAYEPRFFSDMGYCSDSRGAWHHGSPLEHEAVQAKRALQLLTHAIWWGRAAADPTDRLVHFLDARAALLDVELARACAIHRPKERKATSHES